MADAVHISYMISKRVPFASVQQVIVFELDGFYSLLERQSRMQSSAEMNGELNRDSHVKQNNGNKTPDPTQLTHAIRNDEKAVII